MNFPEMRATALKMALDAASESEDAVSVEAVLATAQRFYEFLYGCNKQGGAVSINKDPRS